VLPKGENLADLSVLFAFRPPLFLAVRLAELELIERERRMVERRIKEARFPTVKSLDSFDFTAIPSLNKTLVLELARCEYIARRENVIAVGNAAPARRTSRSG
jgi:DNA replication protein DnaC